MTNEPDDSDVLEHSDLRPAGARQSSGARDIWRVIHRRGWRWSPFVVSLALLTALIVSVTPQGGALLRAIQTFGRAPTPVTVSSIRVDSPPGHVIAAPTTVLRTPPAPMLGQAPARCAATAPALTHVGPPQWGAAIGRAPVWLAGMSGAYPTLRLGREASANAYDWSAPYTQFGWPAPIGLTLKNGFNEPVRLTGWNINTGEAVSFGFVQAGAWGAPLYVSPDYNLDPSSGAIPAGGSDSSGVFWYGYTFVPRAGCYAMTASWQGGSWKAIVSAGR